MSVISDFETWKEQEYEKIIGEMIAVPTAWKIARDTKMGEHHKNCSFRLTVGLRLCSCDVLWQHIKKDEEQKDE